MVIFYNSYGYNLNTKVNMGKLKDIRSNQEISGNRGRQYKKKPENASENMNLNED